MNQPHKSPTSGFLADLAPDEVKPVVDEYTGIYDAGLDLARKPDGAGSA